MQSNIQHKDMFTLSQEWILVISALSEECIPTIVVVFDMQDYCYCLFVYYLDILEYSYLWHQWDLGTDHSFQLPCLAIPDKPFN